MKINERFELQLWSPTDGFVDSACFPSCLELQKVEANQDGRYLYVLKSAESILFVKLDVLFDYVENIQLSRAMLYSNAT